MDTKEVSESMVIVGMCILENMRTFVSFDWHCKYTIDGLT